MKNEKTNEGYPKWNKAEGSGNQQWQEETRTQSNDLEQKEKNKHPSKWRNKNSKSEETLTNLWDNLKHSNIQIIGVPEGEEENPEIENLFEQIMKENFPNLAKDIDFQEVQEAQRVSEKLDPKRNTPRHYY